MRPDRFRAVFCLSVPYVPRGNVSVFERMRESGHQNDFYMFEQIRPDADQIWADAAVTIPGILYWASGSAPADGRWSPMDPARSFIGQFPVRCPHGQNRYVNHSVAEFQRTGFHGGLNYYRAADRISIVCGIQGGKDYSAFLFHLGRWMVKEFYPLTIDQLRGGLPGLVGGIELDNVGHWVQHEAPDVVNDQLVKFLRIVSPV